MRGEREREREICVFLAKFGAIDPNLGATAPNLCAIAPKFGAVAPKFGATVLARVCCANTSIVKITQVN